MDTEPNNVAPDEPVKVKETTVWEKPPQPFWNFGATIGFGVLIFLIAWVAQAIVSVVYVLPVVQSNPTIDQAALQEMLLSDSAFITITAAVNLVFMTGMTLVFMKIRKATTLGNYLSLKKLPVKMMLLVTGIIVALFFVCDFIFNALNTPFVLETYSKAYTASAWPPTLWLSVALFAPITQETFLRGFLFQGMAQSRVGRWGAIIIPAALWVLLYLQYDIATIVLTFILGVVLGFFRYRSGSLWAPLLMFFLWNVMTMVYVTLGIGSVFG